MTGFRLVFELKDPSRHLRFGEYSDYVNPDSIILSGWSDGFYYVRVMERVSDEDLSVFDGSKGVLHA